MGNKDEAIRRILYERTKLCHCADEAIESMVKGGKQVEPDAAMDRFIESVEWTISELKGYRKRGLT